MSKRVTLFRNNSGDTIVEVLIAIAVVSLVLGAAFTSSNRSLQTTQRSQERNEALKYAESQVELLKADRLNTAVTSPTTVGSQFCMDETPRAVTDLSNSACNKGPDNRYRLLLQTVDDDPLTYTATASWEPLGAGEQQTITLTYRTR